MIVESPAKAKTINRYLGDSFVVMASMGHVRDLPTKGLGVDIEHDFKPEYEPLADRRKVLAELKKAARTAPEVYLATDLDREGEAIAWHLAESLGVPPERLRRVIFNEITRPAIQEAFSHPSEIDLHKVDAQQARRILDRIVGYQVSPLLWRKVAVGLSAGRVQTVTVRLIVEREQAIAEFAPEEYWKISAVFTPELSAAEALDRQWRQFRTSANAEGQLPTQAQQLEFLARHNAFRADLVEWKGEPFSAAQVAPARALAEALGLADVQVRSQHDPAGKGPAANRVAVTGQVRRPGGRCPVRYVVRSVDSRPSQTRPSPPFTTATMQQAAAVQLRFSTSRTMRLAQQLYEGVEVPGEGSAGLITYMRTDSVNLSAQAIGQARAFLAGAFGDRYVPEKANVYRSSARAQAAHEAIRPTDVARTPESLHGALEQAQWKLYDLIWRRFVACQMAPAQWNVTEALVDADTPAGKAVFKAGGRQLVFDGFLRVAGRARAEEQTLPGLSAGAEVAPVDIDPSQHFTQPPPRFTEASLVKALEAEGIGRPSTYASIIQTIQDRGYVQQFERKFNATDLGIKVTEKLVNHFSDIFELRFTARLEEELDEVEEGRVRWVEVLREFYGPFKKDLDRAGEEMVHAKAESEPSDYTCPKCSKPMVYRWSKTGRYLACTGYPDCKTTFPVDRQGKKVEKVLTDVACPKCNQAMVLRKGRFGPFLSCSKYPDCDGIVRLDRKGQVRPPTAPPLVIDVPCPKCKSPLNLRRSRRGPWLSCSRFPKCRGRLGWNTLPEEQQTALLAGLDKHEQANPTPTLRKTDGSPVPPDFKPLPPQGSGGEPASPDEGAPDGRLA